MHSTGMNLFQLGLFEQTLAPLQKARDTRTQLLAVGHTDILTTLRDLGGVYQRMGNFELAEALMAQALNDGQQALGDDHPLVISLLNDYSVLLMMQMRVAEAVPLFKQSAEATRQLHGDEHAHTKALEAELEALGANNARL